MIRLIFMLVLSLFFTTSEASKLSQYLHKSEARQQAKIEAEQQKIKAEEAKQRQQAQQELREDMNFSDFVFHQERRFVDSSGQPCREYHFRSKSNPFLHGVFTACNEH